MGLIAISDLMLLNPWLFITFGSSLSGNFRFINTFLWYQIKYQINCFRLTMNDGKADFWNDCEYMIYVRQGNSHFS